MATNSNDGWIEEPEARVLLRKPCNWFPYQVPKNWFVMYGDVWSIDPNTEETAIWGMNPFWGIGEGDTSNEPFEVPM